jgi:hypothetical protein
VSEAEPFSANFGRVTEQLGGVRADLGLLDAEAASNDQIARYLIGHLRTACDNAEGSVILANNKLASPCLIVGRSVVEDLIVTYWATQGKDNADKVLRRSDQEVLRIMRNQTGGPNRVAMLRRKTTGEDVTDQILKATEVKELDKRLNLYDIAKECGLKKIYDIPYRILSLPTHGNVQETLAENPGKVVRACLEAIVSALRAMHMIVSNYVREGRITDRDAILKLMFPSKRRAVGV